MIVFQLYNYDKTQYLYTLVSLYSRVLNRMHTKYIENKKYINA